MSPIIRLTWRSLVCQLLQHSHPLVKRFHEESSGLVFGEVQAKPSALGTQVNFFYCGDRSICLVTLSSWAGTKVEKRSLFLSVETAPSAQDGIPGKKQALFWGSLHLSDFSEPISGLPSLGSDWRAAP
jgi:hypothetical protein